MIVIGLDISTSIVGVAVLDRDENIKEVNHIDLRKIDSKDYGKMADKVEEYFIDLKNKYAGEEIEIFVEEAGKKFRAGTSSAATIFTLARFNGIVCYCAWKTFGKLPIELDVKAARKKIGLIMPKFAKGTKYEEKKKQIKNTVLDFLMMNKKFTPEEMGFEKTNHGNWQIWSLDRADAIVISLSGIKHLK